MAKSVAKASGMMGLTAEMLGKFSHRHQPIAAGRVCRPFTAALTPPPWKAVLPRRSSGWKATDASGARFF